MLPTTADGCATALCVVVGCPVLRPSVAALLDDLQWVGWWGWGGRKAPFAGPPIRCHPVSGLPVIWSLPMFLESYEGMDEAASRRLLEQIMLPGTSGDAVLEHTWRTGDLILWALFCFGTLSCRAYRSTPRLIIDVNVADGTTGGCSTARCRGWTSRTCFTRCSYEPTWQCYRRHHCRNFQARSDGRAKTRLASTVIHNNILFM